MQAMNEEDRTFHLQNQFGNACTSDDFVIFNISVLFPETVSAAPRALFEKLASLLNIGAIPAVLQ
ncbi:unnamed protein product [Timema podura]|uniref:Uncharacterized protein n=1 Tax=Timema podura TaxID=61482 RepID=A0ABN7P7L9_TIMPD|nr:unnamed protein product [Timema podura]